jgi:hypothetical protein
MVRNVTPIIPLRQEFGVISTETRRFELRFDKVVISQ